jgi:hypothetical protein
MDMALIIGLAGMALILAAFVMNVFKKIAAEDITFLWLNLFGSALLTWYAILTNSPPFLILNAVWSAVALWGLLHHHPKVHKDYGSV